MRRFFWVAAWGCAILGVLCFEAGILLIRVRLAPVKVHNPWLSWGAPTPNQLWTLLLVGAGAALVWFVMAVVFLRFSLGSAEERKPRWWIPSKGTIVFLVLSCLVTGWQVWAGSKDFDRWQKSRQKMLVEMRQQQDFNRTHLVNFGTSGGPGYLTPAIHSSPFVITDQGATCYTFTGNEFTRWDLRLGRELGHGRFPIASMLGEFVGRAAFSSDDRRTAVFLHGSQRHRLVLLSPQGDIEREIFQKNDSAAYNFAVPLLPDQGRRAWVTRYLYEFGDGRNSYDYTLTLWNLESSEPMVELELEGDRSHGFALSDDLRILSVLKHARNPQTGRNHGEIRLLDAVSGEVLRQSSLESPPMHGGRLAIDSAGLKYAYQDETDLLLCEFEDSGLARVITHWPRLGPIGALRFSQDGQRLAACHLEKAETDFSRGDWRQDELTATIEIVTLPTGETTRIPVTANRNQSGQPGDFTPDLKLLILSGHETLFRYHVATGRELLQNETAD